MVITVTIAPIEHHDQKQVEEERVYLAYTYTSLFIIEGGQDRNSSRAGAWRQELMQRPWRSAAYCLVLHGSLNLPRSDTIHKVSALAEGPGLPHL